MIMQNRASRIYLKKYYEETRKRIEEDRKKIPIFNNSPNYPYMVFYLLGVNIDYLDNIVYNVPSSLEGSKRYFDYLNLIENLKKQKDILDNIKDVLDKDNEYLTKIAKITIDEINNKSIEWINDCDYSNYKKAYVSKIEALLNSTPKLLEKYGDTLKGLNQEFDNLNTKYSLGINEKPITISFWYYDTGFSDLNKKYQELLKKIEEESKFIQQAPQLASDLIAKIEKLLKDKSKNIRKAKLEIKKIKDRIISNSVDDWPLLCKNLRDIELGQNH